MLRHLILALFLIGLSLSAVAAPAQAAPDTAAQSCHNAVSVAGVHHRQDGDSGKAAVKHVCVGCIAGCTPPAASDPLPCRAMAPTAPPATTPAAREAEPTTPPPRT